MLPSAFPPPREEREENIVYFYGDSDSRSWAATLDHDSSELMSEEHIGEFIKHGRPDVFEQLRGLPFSSSDISMSPHAQHIARRASELTTETNSVEAQPTHVKTDQALSFKSQSEDATISTHTHLKKNILSRLLDDHVLVVKNMSPGSAPLRCQTPLCVNGHIVPCDKHFLQLLDLAALKCRSKEYLGTQPEHYCLQCLEESFDGQLLSMDAVPLAQEPGSTLLDGVDRTKILFAAERLYAALDQPNNQPKVRPVSPPGPECTDKGSSHSNSGLQRRRCKQFEIGISLAEVAKYEKATLSARAVTSSASSASPSLLITRLPYQEPEQERYKKQGLRRYDRVKYTREQKRQLSEESKTSPTSTEPYSPARYCYCREDDDGTELIRCSSDWCPVGWFHLRCSGLEQVPTINQKFFCRYCSDDFGLFNPVEQSPKVLSPESDLLDSPDEGFVDFKRLAITDTGDEEWENTDESRITAMTDTVVDEDTNISRFATSSVEKGNILFTIENNPKPEDRQQVSLPSFSTWGTPINMCASLPSKFQFQESTDRNHLEDADEVAVPADIDSIGLDGLEVLCQYDYARNRCCETRKLNILDYEILKFYDLAPFMFAEGLTTTKAELFQAWKKTRPDSRLLALQNSTVRPNERVWTIEPDLGPIEKEALSIKLSEVLGDCV